MIKRQELYFIILFAILLIPNIFVLFNFSDIEGNVKMSVAYIVLSLLVWSLPLIFLQKRIYFIIGSLFLLASPLEIIFVKNLGTPHTVGFIDSVLKTNFNEVLEQLSGNLLMVFTFIVVVFIYIILAVKTERKAVGRRMKIIIISSFVCFNIALFAQMMAIQKGNQHTFLEKADVASNSLLLKYRKIYPANLLINLYQEFKNRRSINQLNENLQDFSFQARSQNPDNQEEIYVLVIGETARFDHFHINGYERGTSPYLDKTKNLISFRNVYSQANLTSISVPQIITRAGYNDIDLQFKEKTIADAFLEAGFYTAWFANQSGGNPIIKRLQNEVHYFKSNHSDVDIRNFLDEDILSDYQKILQEKHHKKFIVIHSLGSHFRYTNRYPSSFEKYAPVMEETGYNNLDFENKDKIINSYDNSILYTDYFLNLLITNLQRENKKAVLLYVSDHGENLYDDDKKYFAHGTVTPTKQEYHIPYFIWFSDKYQESEVDKIARLKNNINAASSSSSTFYTLLDLANIKYKNSEKEMVKSLSSAQYIPLKERFMLNSERKIIKIK